jgi:hypothetical protein
MRSPKKVTVSFRLNPPKYNILKYLLLSLLLLRYHYHLDILAQHGPGQRVGSV